MSDTQRSTVHSDTRQGGTPETGCATRPDVSLRVPDHTLLRCIGSGGYGEVWLSRNVMGIHRAVKVVYRATFANERPYEREFNGIRLYEPVSRTHDELIDILHVGRDDQAGYFYYVMELADDEVEGQVIDPERYQPRTLGTEIVRKGRLPFEECLRLALSLSAGLGHLHRKGLIHRDLKPSNIVFVHGIAKIADIGLVAEAGSARSFVGTEGFIPPEGPGTIQADIYSLGKVLYEISSGKDRKTYPQIPTIIEETGDLRGYLELNEVILRACEDQSGRRYASADAMHGDLLLLNAGKSVRRLHLLESRLARLKRVALAGLGVALVGAAIYFQISREMHLATEQRQRQAGQMVARGTRLMEEGDSIGSLPWYVAALALDARDPQRSETHRARIAAVLGRCPTLINHWIHGTYVNAACVSHDGRWCAIAPSSGMASVWDLTGGDKPRWTLPKTSELECAAFRNDDRVLACGGKGGFKVWALGKERPILEAELENTTIYSIAFNPSGDRLLTAGYVDLGDGRYDGRVDLWDANSGERIVPQVVRSSQPFRCAVFSPDGHRVVVGGELPGSEGWAQVWDLDTLSPVGSPVIHHGEGWVVDVDFSPDSRLFVTSSFDQSARICDAATGQVIQNLEHPAGVRTARFSPDGRYLVTAGWDFSARVWDIATGKLAFAPLKDDARHLMYAGFAADGRRVVTVSATSGIGLWDLTTGFQRPSVESRVYSESGDRVASLGPEGIQVRRVHGDERLPGRYVSSFRIERMKFNRTGSGLLAYSAVDPSRGYESRWVQFWKIGSSNGLSAPFKCDDGITNSAISDNGHWLACWGPTNGIQLRDLTRDNVSTQRLLPGHPIQCVEFNHAGDRMAIAGGAQVTLWDVPPRAEPRFDIECEDTAAHVAFSWDDRRLIIACESEGTVEERAAHVHDSESGKELLPPLRHGDGVLFAEFAPNGRTILTAGEDCQARLWDAKTGKYLLQLDHPNQVYSARFSSDSRWVVTVCRDKKTRVWDAEMAEPITPPFEQPWYAFDGWFLDGANGIVTQRSDGENVVWQLPRESRPLPELITIARMLSGRQVLQADQISAQPREALLAAWKQLMANRPGNSSSSWQNILEWHRHEAETSEANQMWRAAEFHWTRYLSPCPAPQFAANGIGAAEGQPRASAVGGALDARHERGCNARDWTSTLKPIAEVFGMR